MFALFFVFIIHLSPCVAVVDVEYSFKYSYEGQSDHEHDYFGFSLATSNHKLVVGAPGTETRQRQRGSITVMPNGLEVRGPAGEKNFGESVDINQEFMVVSGHPDMFVYKASSPFNMVAKIPIGRLPYRAIATSVVISDDNTIAIVRPDDNCEYWLTIYQYDGSESWHIADKFDSGPLSRQGAIPSLAVHGDTLVVGVPNVRVRVYNRVKGKWMERQTIKEDGVEYFGWSVTVYGQHLAVSAFRGDVFTYKLDQHTNTWVGNGRLSVPSHRAEFLHLHKDILAITVNNKKYYDLCGVVYKLSTATATTTTTKTTINNNYINNGSFATTTTIENNINGNVVWEEIARLTTKGDPITTDDYRLHFGISVEEKAVFTGRNELFVGYGKVFVHDLTDINN